MAIVRLTDASGNVVDGFSTLNHVWASGRYTIATNTAVGWYCVANFTAISAGVSNYSPAGIIMLSGPYMSYNVTKAVLAFAGSNSGDNKMTLLVCSKFTSPTKLRLRYGSAGNWYIDIYKANTGQEIVSISLDANANGVEFFSSPSSVPDTPTDGSTVKVSIDLNSTTTGAVQTA